MYRVIFLFDIGDLYLLIEEAADRLQQRQTPEVSVRSVVECWFRQRLAKDMHLALLESEVDGLTPLFDQEFQSEARTWEERLYRQLSMAIYSHAHPCLESWCEVKLNRFNLILTFNVGPTDYGARLA